MPAAGDQKNLALASRGLSIGTKLTIATLAVLVLVSVLLYRELTKRERQSLLSAKETAATMVADLFAASLSAPLDFQDADAIATELSHLEKNPEVMCAAVWMKGEKDPTKTLSRGCDAGTTPVLAASERAVFREDRVEVTRMVRGRENAVVGSTRVVFSLARENAAFAASERSIFWLTFLLATGTAAVLIVISRTQIIRPLRRLSDAARRVGGGDLSTRVDVRSTDELGQLAQAFNRMSEEIGDRERKLAAATQNLRDLFDHMGQAIVAFDREGRIRGATSRQASRIFGKENFEGLTIDALLFGDSAGERAGEAEAQAFKEWREAAFEMTVESWSEFAELAPKAAMTGKLPLELEFRPVVKDGEIDRVMVLATDVSEKRRLEEAVATQEQAHAKRMAAMRKLVAGGAQLFVHYIEVAKERVTTFFERLDDESTLDSATVDEMFRHVHTMKGEARAFDLLELESALESLEDTLSALRRNAQALIDDRETREDACSAIRAGLFKAESAIDRARNDFVAVSPVGSAALEMASVRKSDLEAVLRLSSAGGELAKAIERLAARPFGESLATIADRAPDWAAREGKRIELVIEGREVHVPKKLADVLGGVMTHLVRNAVAHGIESPADRARAGKNEVGSIWASAGIENDKLVITVEDDGAGIDFARVKEKAGTLDLDPTSDPTDLIFATGLSTRESTEGLAGRGVGLDAVRAYLAEAGYQISVISEQGAGTKFVILPSKAQ